MRLTDLFVVSGRLRGHFRTISQLVLFIFPSIITNRYTVRLAFYVPQSVVFWDLVMYDEIMASLGIDKFLWVSRLLFNLILMYAPLHLYVLVIEFIPGLIIWFLAFFLPLHSSILKPCFHLRFVQEQSLCQLGSAGSVQVFLLCERLLQNSKLQVRKHSSRLSTSSATGSF